MSCQPKIKSSCVKKSAENNINTKVTRKRVTPKPLQSSHCVPLE